MRNYIVEKDFMVDGYRCAIVGQKMGHRCGYLGLPKGHKYYGEDYDNINIEVHGGWTYSGDDNEYPVESDGIWWIGFDCAHWGDGKDFELIKALASTKEYMYLKKMKSMFLSDGTVRTVEFVEQELRNVVEQLKELE